jgi:hypothetical protein
MELSLNGTPIRITRWTVVLVVISLGLVGSGISDYYQQSQTIEDAVAVDATVLETDISQEGGGRGGPSYDVTVEFTYQYQGTNYTGTRLYPGAKSYETESAAEDELEPYNAGETVTAYVDPDAPSNGFLKKQTTENPFWLIGFGLLLLVVRILHDTGVKTPAETELRPESELERTPPETLFGIDHKTLHRASRRLIIGSAVVFVGGILGMMLVMGAKALAVGGSYDWGSVGWTHPLGLLFITAAVGVLGVIGSLLLYTGWSFTEYRRLRARLEEPRPPSPFRHPTRLEAILYIDDDELGEYHTRVKYTGFALVLVVFFSGIVFAVAV